MFVNNGDFNQCLIETNFKLVLSGHKHIGDEIYAAMPRYAYPDINEKSWAKPMIECGFLSISAPTLLRYEDTGVETGFYIIEIQINPYENIALLNVTRFEFNLADKRLTPRTFPYRIALTRLNEIGFSEFGQKARIAVLDKVTRQIYSANPIQPLERVLRLTSQVQAWNDALTAYRERSRISDDNVFGIYGASVMTPESWWAYDFADAFSEIFADYMRRRYSSKSLLRQSDTLRRAIQISRANADAFREATKGIKEFDENQRSLSLKLQRGPFPWLNDRTVSSDNSLSRIICSPIDSDTQRWEIPFDSLPTPEANFKGIFEICRILLWPIEYFDSEYALSVIKVHERFEVPLFWLDPKTLTGCEGEPRQQIGSFALWSFSELERGKLCPSTASHFFFNNVFGKTPSANQMYDPVPNEAARANDVYKLWGTDNVPKSLLNYPLPRIAEIALLLRRPDLFFAVDVWFARNTNSAIYMNTGFGKNLEACRKWLRSEILA